MRFINERIKHCIVKRIRHQPSNDNRQMELILFEDVHEQLPVAASSVFAHIDYLFQ